MIESTDDLISFLKHYHRQWPEKPGFNSAPIPPDLPLGLRKVYSEFGGRIALVPGPFGTQDYLLPLSQLERVDGMIEFAAENQGVWSCRCPLNDDNPPVYSDAPSQNSYDFKVVCQSLNHFLITLCLQEAMFSSLQVIAIDGKQLKDVVTTEPAPLWLNGYYVHGKPTHDFYIIPNRDAIIMKLQDYDPGGDDYLWIGSNDERIVSVIQDKVAFDIRRK